MNEKIRFLDKTFFLDLKNKEKTIENWLGIKEIKNTSRNVNENVADYIIRHTRNIPRDIVIIGNAISNRIQEIKLTTYDFDNFHDQIKKIVHHYAKRFAREQVIISSNHLTSNLMPADAIQLGVDKMYTAKYTGDQEFLNVRNTFINKIEEVIKFMGKDRFDFLDLMIGKAFAVEIFGVNSELNLFDILWQNSLIGYDVNDGFTKFYSERSIDFQLPIDKNHTYAFHSILIDYLNLKAVGKPVKIKTFN